MIKRDLLVGFGRNEDEWVFKALSGLGRRCELDGSGVWVPVSDMEDVEGEVRIYNETMGKRRFGFYVCKSKIGRF